MKRFDGIEAGGVVSGRSFTGAWIVGKTIEKSKIMSIRFVYAYQHVSDNELEEVLCVSLGISVSDIPKIDGKTALWCLMILK